MKLKEFCVDQKWCLGFAEVRRFISSKVIQINDITATDADIELKNGDIVKFLPCREAIVKEN